MSAFQEWASLYDDEIKLKWEEGVAELKRISMIYCAFEKELHRLKLGLKSEIKALQADIETRNSLRRSKLELSTNEVKENKSGPLRDIKNEIMQLDYFIESPNTCSFFENVRTTPSPKANTMESSTSPVISKCKNNKTSGASRNPSVFFPIVKHKSTPNKDDSNIMECSLVDATPNLKNTKWNSKTSLSRHINKKKLKQQSTITQMYNSPKSKKRKLEDSMKISEMISIINESSGSETDVSVGDDATVDNLHVPSFDKNKEVSKKKDNIKKTQKWSCKECENYFKGENLTSDVLEEKMRTCSNHHGSKFKERHETFEGFWDLSIAPTPSTLQTSVFMNYRK